MNESITSVFTFPQSPQESYFGEIYFTHQYTTQATAHIRALKCIL